MRHLLFPAALCLSPALLPADGINEGLSLTVSRAPGAITVDGVLDEVAWQSSSTASGFYVNFPHDTSHALARTEVRLTYDDHYLYIGAVCYDSLGGDFVVQSLKRDFNPGRNDAFAVFIDPMNDRTNGFAFSVNPLGVQREELIAFGGIRDSDPVWDNRWHSAVKTSPGKWTVEMAIPFKTLRYKEGRTTWGINFARNDLKLNERSSWAPVPRNFDVSHLGYTGVLAWDEAPKKAGANVSVIPYTIGDLSRDFSVAENKAEGAAGAGLDAKVAVTSSLNLDITVNPDFSQVEVDRQITNLTRFSLFFPEKRTFFTENSDLFNQFGFSKIRPFFSRRVGLYEGEKIPITAGLRLSGSVNEKWRIGLMSIQTEGRGTLELPAYNHVVAAFERRMWGQSNIAGIFVNRQGFDGSRVNHSDYNRIAGLEFRYVGKGNKLRGKIFQHYSLAPGKLPDHGANASWIMYNDRNIRCMWNHEYVGKNYFADIGFVPRAEFYDPVRDTVVNLAYYRLEPEFTYSFFPASGKIRRISPELYSSVYTDSAFRVTEAEHRLSSTLEFRSSSEFKLSLRAWETGLVFPADITGRADSLAQYLPAGSYRYNDGSAEYSTDKRKRLSCSVEASYGSFFNGSKASGKIEAGYRAQPWGIFSLSYTRDEVRLPEPYAGATLHLVGPMIELSFTKSLFFTTFVQYNTQADNLNINSRFQWRFRPMSDVFIVYTDNYLPHNFAVKNRALVVKIIWWLSV